MLSIESLQAETARCCPQWQYGFQNLPGRITELRERAHGIVAAARRVGRAPSNDEQTDIDCLVSEKDRCEGLPMPPRHKLDNPDPDGYTGSPATTGQRFLAADGREVRALTVRERLSDSPQPDGKPFVPLSLGKAIVGLTTGRWDNARAERLAMAEGGNAVGGYMVPEAFSLQVIDLARANSALMNAGAITIPWSSPSDEMSLGRVIKDPTFSLVSENAEIPPSDLNFDRVVFSAKKLAALCVLSRELAEDSPNIASLVETTLAKALGAELDRLGLIGVGGQQLNGLLNWPDVDSTGSIGAIGWEDLHGAALKVKGRNHTPSGYICHPDIGGDLDLIMASSAGTWLGAPPSFAACRGTNRRIARRPICSSVTSRNSCSASERPCKSRCPRRRAPCLSDIKSA